MKLTIEKTTKAFKKKLAVNDFSYTFEPGIYGLLGPNGSGKTTLIRMICDILKPTKGNILLDDTSISALDEDYRDLLGYLPQEFGYYPNYTGDDFLSYLGHLKGLSAKEINIRKDELLSLVGLSNERAIKIKNYSGGMKQRLGIAQALLNDPKILVLDEPTAGLDPKERARFRNLIATLAGERIVILSTHIVSDLEHLANRTLIMKDGKLLVEGTHEQLMKVLENRVFSLVVEAGDLEEVNERMNVISLTQIDSGKILVRYVTENDTFNGKNETPNLEDLFMYIFGE